MAENYAGFAIKDHHIYTHCSKFSEQCDKSALPLNQEKQRETTKRTFSINYWDDPSCKDVIVIPSLSFDTTELAKIEGISHYEERQLFNLILLRNPDRRVIFVTSLPLDPSVIEYYWKLLPMKVSFSEIRHRLILLSTYDASPTCLTVKILRRPRLIKRIQQAIRDPNDACITTFNCTKHEVQLAKLLGIPLLSSKNDSTWWGTKAGGRELFKACAINCPPGTGDCRDVKTLISEIASLWEENPSVHVFVVKLNEGFSGEGNAILELRSVHESRLRDKFHHQYWTREQLEGQIAKEMKRMRFQGSRESWETFKEKIPKLGCIAEVYILGATHSPSFQGYVDINGDVFSLSTHEQIMGGPDGQVYKGCRFPAQQIYRKQIQEIGEKVGKGLAERGVTDHFSLDFVATPKGDSYELYALEINLRKGGTTHPMMTLKLLCEGTYDCSSGLYLSSKSNQGKYYIASDNLVDEKYVGLLPHDIMEVFGSHRLHYCPKTEVGTVFHLLGALSEHGKIGVTCIGNSEEEARHIYEETVELLNTMAEETQKMLREYYTD